MSRLKLEQETIITFNEQEPTAEIYTHNRRLKKRLTDLCDKYPDEFSITMADNGAGGSTFTIPKKRITVTAPRSLTEEQKEKMRQNFKK